MTSRGELGRVTREQMHARLPVPGPGQAPGAGAQGWRAACGPILRPALPGHLGAPGGPRGLGALWLKPERPQGSRPMCCMEGLRAERGLGEEEQVRGTQRHLPGLLGIRGGTWAEPSKARTEARAEQGGTWRRSTGDGQGGHSSSSELNGAGCRTGQTHRPQRREAGGGVGRGCVSLPTPSHPSIRAVFGGRGQDQSWSQDLAAAFHSPRPRINCPKTSSITKKGNCENTGGQALPHTSPAIPPALARPTAAPTDRRCAGRGRPALSVRNFPNH